jgi:hypothetical protein
LDYDEYPDGDYRQVQSSILKAVLRACDLSPDSLECWQPLLELALRSPRVAENQWACRHLERLLGKWFAEGERLRWLRGQARSETIRGSSVASVLSNVLWVSR